MEKPTVDIWSKPRTWVILGVSVVGLFLLYQLWVWEVERVEVPPDHFLVKIHLWGEDLPEGAILAPDASYKGIQRELLPEGRHFLNPLLYSFKVEQLLEVPVGQCAVLTRKAGPEISAERLARGEYLARGEFGDPDGERGIVEKVLLPGKHRVNPYEYSWTLHKAVKVEANQVGVRVLKWGLDPRTLRDRKSPYVVPHGYRGVQEKPVPPGDYYLNPDVESIVPVDIRSHPVEFADIEFPSRDGFTIRPHVMVAYKVIPGQAPDLFVMLCDEGKLSQEHATAEQQRKNPILQKVVLPLIRGYVRIEGSKYDARDYVSQQRDDRADNVVNPREKLQEELMKKVAPRCREAGVIIESITVAQPDMNPALTKLAAQIAERERTRVAREKNKQLVEQHKQEQEQKAKELLAEQRSRVVDANAKLKVAMTRAKQDKEVAEAKLKNELKSAQARLDGAREQARLAVIKGKGEAAITMAENEAEVSGLKTAIAGFTSAEQFAQYHVLTKLAPALSEIFASDTGEFAKVFSTYMTPGKKVGIATLPTPGSDRTAAAKGPGK
jgi:hypothetical protein